MIKGKVCDQVLFDKVEIAEIKLMTGRENNFIFISDKQMCGFIRNKQHLLKDK